VTDDLDEGQTLTQTMKDVRGIGDLWSEQADIMER